MRHTVLIFVGVLLALPAYAGSLRTALDQVWERNPEAQVLEAKRAESDARAVAANSLMPGAPALVVGHRSDRLNDDAGAREWEAGVEMPMWLPGQRGARQREARAGRSGLEASIRALRLKLAGDLRETIWQLRATQAQIRLDEARVQTAQKLAEDVARRVRAGELARTDLNLAQNEWRSAQATLLRKRSQLLQAEQAYAALTGDSTPPEDSAEDARAPASSDDHPLLEEARLAIDVAQAQVEVARQSRRDNPELALSTRRERSAREPYANTVALELRLPLATAARNLPLTSAAQTALTGAQSEHRRLGVALEHRRQQAEQALAAADRLLALAQQQRDAARENLGLIQKAFDLGETDLFTLLRARSAALEAEQAYSQQQIAQALARARLNQAQGVLP